MKTDLIIALTYYNAPLMLQEQIINLQSYFKHRYVLEVKVILIDDGSRLHPAKIVLDENPLTTIPLELYRIEEDIQSNVWGARNLAFNIAMMQNVPWVLCLDIDHVFPFHSFENFSSLVKQRRINSATYYYPSRHEKQIHGFKSIGRHTDSFFINPELFWKTGGYDEDLKNFYYNGAGFNFRSNLAHIAKGEELKDVYTIFYPSSIIADASPLEGVERKRFEGNVPKNKKPSVLNFDWERLI